MKIETHYLETIYKINVTYITESEYWQLKKLLEEEPSFDFVPKRLSVIKKHPFLSCLILLLLLSLIWAFTNFLYLHFTKDPSVFSANSASSLMFFLLIFTFQLNNGSISSLINYYLFVKNENKFYSEYKDMVINSNYYGEY